MSEQKLDELFRCKEDLRNDEDLDKLEWFYEWYTLEYKILEARGLSNEKAIQELKSDREKISLKIDAFFRDIERHWEMHTLTMDCLCHINVCFDDISDCQKEKVAIDRVIRVHDRNYFLGVQK